MVDIYTIGYSGFQIEQFLFTLKQYNINSLIDVRSNPVSRFYVDYNQNALEPFLRLHGIIYRNYKCEFGARQNDLKYYKNGYLNFAEYVRSNSFLEGVRKIEAGIKMNYTFAFMCAEKEPIDCHRCIMVAREFHKLGYKIKNIMPDGSYKTQDDIEKQLVGKYFPNMNQITLFADNLSWEEMVNKGYFYRNKEIGYRIHGEQEKMTAL